MSMLNTKEHYDLMAKFERDFRYERLEREDHDMWAKNRIYKNGNMNNLFLAYRMGYAYGKVA
jgi:hypothetical protein